MDKEFIVNFDRAYTLLILVPEEIESHICVNVLSFFGFPMNVEEDNLQYMIIKKEMGFQKDDPYPCLMIESSDPNIPSADLTGYQEILGFLRDKGFTSDFKSHSAKESQTMGELIEDQVSPLMQQILLPFKSKVQFYQVPRHFRQVEVKKERADFAALYFWKMVKGLRFYFKDKKEFEGERLSK